MKNTYYENYERFEEAVVQFFKSFQSNLSDMKTLLNFKFGVIKAS